MLSARQANRHAGFRTVQLPRAARLAAASAARAARLAMGAAYHARLLWKNPG